MRYVGIIILFYSLLTLTFAQSDAGNSHPFSKSFAISGHGGVNIAATDFPDAKIDYFGKGSIEYYLPSSSPSVFGFKLFVGSGFIAGKGLSSQDPLYAGITEFETKIVYGGAGLTYSYSFGKVVQPYISAGVSYLIFNPLQADGTKMPRNQIAAYAKEEIDYIGEFGLRFMLSNRFSFNVGYAYNYVANDNLDDIFSSENDMFHSLYGGFTLYFMASKDSDSDGDGIKDKTDMCENTPAGVEVDEFGCPKDNDKDGIPDYKDLCGGTPENVAVDSTGCPIDTDMDGIADYLDKCPDTETNTVVDSHGCPKVDIVELAPKVEIEEPEEEIKEVMEHEKVLILGGTANFRVGEAELLPNPESGLEKLCAYMKANPDLNWVIEGHTDNFGNEISNFQLSLKRAKSVFNYFVANGLNPDRFKVLAAGSTKPIADNSIEFGRALNRRVVIEEKESFDKKLELMTTVESANYNAADEYNIESLIFTDGTYYTIQVSSWKSKLKAEKVFKELVMKGHPAFILKSVKDENQDQWYRIRIGYFDNLEGAREYMKLIR